MTNLVMPLKIGVQPMRNIRIFVIVVSNGDGGVATCGGSSVDTCGGGGGGGFRRGEIWCWL